MSEVTPEVPVLTKAELMEQESYKAVDLLAKDGLHMEQSETLKIMQEVDVQCEVIMAGMRVWSDFLTDKELMSKVIGNDAVNMEELIARVGELDQIRNHMMVSAAWMMQLRMQTEATPKVITPALGTEGKIIGLDGTEHMPDERPPIGRTPRAG